jgi:nitroreductase
MMNADPLAPILARTSCRAFRADPLPETDIDRLIEVLRWAPSAGNMQPWRFLVIRSQELRARLARAAGDQDFLAQAPVAFVICVEPERSAARYGERGRFLYALQDTAAATENLLVAATALGYGSCWVGAFDENAVHEILAIPKGLRAVAMVPVGIPAESPARRPRRGRAEIVEIR